MIREFIKLTDDRHVILMQDFKIKDNAFKDTFSIFLLSLTVGTLSLTFGTLKEQMSF